MEIHQAVIDSSRAGCDMLESIAPDDAPVAGIMASAMIRAASPYADSLDKERRRHLLALAAATILKSCEEAKGKL